MKKIMLSLFIYIMFLFGIAANAETPDSNKIQPKDFNHLLGTLNGISDNLLKQHFQLYQGYVKSINEMDSKLSENKTPSGNASYSEYRGIVASKPFAHNGVILHELYFSNLSGKPSKCSPQLDKLIIRDFGSYDSYITEFKAASKSARSGWVITGYNMRDNKIHNYIIDLHDEHVPIFVKPLLVFDVWEHSYILDYGINKDAYIEAFLKNIDWNIVSKRLEN